jgi:ESS family glutamate:Na+ symporter
MLKRSIPWLEASLIPTSVLGGGILLLASVIYKSVTGVEMFDTPFFGGNGTTWLELLTYHMLALGFTASALKSSGGKMSKERSVEIFNTGLTTVATYLLQALVGMVVCVPFFAVLYDVARKLIYRGLERNCQLDLWTDYKETFGEREAPPPKK